VVTTDVTQKVTVRLTEVPWDQALDVLIETHGLGKEQVGNVVRISTAAVLKAERDALVAAQKARQDLEPLQTTYLTVNYAKVKELEPKVKTLLSNRPDAALVTDERSNTIMIRDLRRSIDEITTLVSRLDTRTPQVLIESNLIETTPTFARALGMQLEFTNPTTGISVSSQLRAENPLTETVGAAFAVIRSRLGPLADVRAALTAAEQEGKIRIISRPSVVTLNNVESTIASLRILRIALPASTNIASGTGAAAGTAVATEQVRVGIVLSVIPQVSRDGFVLLNIRVKSSSLGTQSPGSVVPDELSREAVSNVLVRDGETVVIGGIMKDSQQDSETGVPYLKDIPVLGWLFKRIREQKDFEELMVFITPRLTTAGSADLPAAEELWRDHMKKTVGESAGDFPSLGPHKP
jgi:type IV pilus assembly protein PilQ